MSSEILYSEILKKFDDAPTRAAKLAVLQKEGDPRFRDFLFYAFHPDIKFDIQPPSYRPAIKSESLCSGSEKKSPARPPDFYLPDCVENNDTRHWN